MEDYTDIDFARFTIYTLHGVWCPAGCGGYSMFYAAPAYGRSYEYKLWCPHCLTDVV